MKNQNFKQVDEIKEFEMVIHEVEDNAVIVNVDGWRMRVYFDKDVKKEKFNLNQNIIIKYKGDISKPHTIRFEKLK
jgi:hypothetical protein